MINISDTQQLKTSVTYYGTGSQTNFDFPFDYLRKAFIHVTINDVEVSDYSIDSRTIIFATAPSEGAIINIYRSTDTTRLVAWADASVLKASDMTISQVQQLHILEEGQDWSKINSIYLDENDSKWQGNNHPMKNISDPVDAKDVVTKGYMETVQGGFVMTNTALKDEAAKQAGIATTKASEAAASASAAATSETNAASSANTAKRWAEASDSPDNTTSKSAKTWASEAAGSASAAKTSETNAKSSETKAANSATTATEKANVATTKASEASASASAAKTSETNAASSATNAQNAASAAKTSETNAKSSETKAANNATTAANSATTATEKAGIATTKASEASASASAAKTSETNAKTSETNASNSASTATTKASEAAGSASAAKTSESNAKTSETNAASSANVALTEANRSKDEADRSQYFPMENLIGKTPNYYKRQALFTPNKTKLTIHANTQINIGNKGYISREDVVLNLADVANAAARQGKDMYVYACQPSDTNSTIPTFVLSMNSTVPDGYTANNSRKIGGFHCICRNVGTISGHAASGYVIGDIIPISVWDLLHRAQSENEGMIWADFDGRWYDIYLAGVVSGKLVSQYGAIIADGASSPAYSGEKFVEEFAKVKKRPLYRNEFMVLAKGSNEGTNIYGSTDPNTAGGHNDTAGRAMISNYFMEEMCGALWQWSADTFEYYPGAVWNSPNLYLDGYSWQTASVYNSAVDSQQYGSCIGLLRRAHLGGSWGDGGFCGSRCVACNDFSSHAWGNDGSRGSSEPRVVNF